MQRLLLLLLLLVFLAGTAFYFKREAVVEQYHRVSTWVSRDKGARAPEGEPSPPQRYSRVPPPHPTGEKQYAPPGTFYVIKRKKVTSTRGVKAVNPGEQVRLLERLPDGKLRVTIENADFVVLASDVTDDLDIAREAEKQYLNAPPTDL